MRFSLAVLHVDMPVTVVSPLGMRLSTIDHITKKYVLVDGCKYDRDTGKRLDGIGEHLLPVTHAAQDTAAKDKLRRQILDVRAEDLLALDLDELQTIVKLLAKGKITGRPKRSIVNRQEP